jgi:predicted membrane chloride channel (bestrophin family)
MIVYDKSRLCDPSGLLFAHRGSVVPGASLRALPSAFLSVIIGIYIPEGLEWMDSGQVLTTTQVWTAATGVLLFLLTFRTNKAYSRFWQGTTLLHQMWGEWFDAASCLVAFTSITAQTKKEKVLDFRHTLVRLMSLMHASALQEIANDKAIAKYDLDTMAHQAEGHWMNFPTLDIGGLDKGTLSYLTMVKLTRSLVSTGWKLSYT